MHRGKLLGGGAETSCTQRRSYPFFPIPPFRPARDQQQEKTEEGKTEERTPHSRGPTRESRKGERRVVFVLSNFVEGDQWRGSILTNNFRNVFLMCFNVCLYVPNV